MPERLETDRLILERLRPEHRDDLGGMHRDPQVMATLGGVRSVEETERVLAECDLHWERYGFGLWAVRVKATGLFAGRGGLKHTYIGERDEVEVAYALLPHVLGPRLGHRVGGGERARRLRAAASASTSSASR